MFHEIILTEDRVCTDKIRRIPKNSLDEVELQVLEMLEAGIIRESCSAYNSNPLLVKKKDGKQRFCVDFRSINKITKRDRYQLPNIDDIIESCAGSKFFSQLDLASGYWGIPIAEKDRHKTAFSVPKGRFEFCRMPFGLVNAQATLQRKVDVVVKKLHADGHKGVEAYVDNILIHSVTEKGHMKLLRVVLQEMREWNFSLRADKCEIMHREIDFLGYHLSENSLQPSRDSVDKLLSIPRPSSKKMVQSFLGLANFNRRFVPQFATVTKPLTRLLSKEVRFKWDSEEDQAFNKVKQMLAEYPCLSIPHWSKCFHIDTDASGVATGAILYQLDDQGRKNPIHYYSKTLSRDQVKWSATERELLAIVHAIERFKVYCSAEMVFHTDHKPLVNILGQKDPRGKVARMLMILEAVDCRIYYVPGKDNIGADFMSRGTLIKPWEQQEKEEYEEDNVVFSTEKLYTNVMCQEQAKDGVLTGAIDQIRKTGKISSGPLKRYGRVSG